VLNVVHGGPDVANMICDHPDIKAVSFIGSTQSAPTSTAAPAKPASAPSA
jgi:acyl-CoA reductase-like NAD-dependent aldehyde dehydrogenase